MNTNNPTAAPEMSDELKKFLEGKEEVLPLEKQVEIHLTAMNRHDRRVWCSRVMRRAGKIRGKALQAKMSVKKVERRAAKV